MMIILWIAYMLKLFIFIVSNLILISIIFFEKNIKNFLKKLNIKREEKNKMEKEIIQYFQFLITFLSSGILFPISMQQILQQRKWIRPIQTINQSILNYYNNGSSFKCSCELTIENYLFSNNIYSIYTKDFLRFFLCVSKIYDSGGNILKYISNYSNDIRDKISFQKKFSAQISQILFQAYVIIASPFVIALVLMIIKPENILFFVTTSSGIFLLFFMIFLLITGCYTIIKIIKIAV